MTEIELPAMPAAAKVGLRPPGRLRDPGLAKGLIPDLLACAPSAAGEGGTVHPCTPAEKLP
jgi:hypothetical protein